MYTINLSKENIDIWNERVLRPELDNVGLYGAQVIIQYEIDIEQKSWGIKSITPIFKSIKLQGSLEGYEVYREVREDIYLDLSNYEKIYEKSEQGSLGCFYITSIEINFSTKTINIVF